MNKAIDPRSLGFNYGQPLPLKDLPLLYHDLELVAEGYRDDAQEASRKAWELLRHARIACTPAEREAAMVQLRAHVRRTDKSFGGTSSGDHYALDALGARIPA